MRPMTPSDHIILPLWIFCKAHRKPSLSIVSCLTGCSPASAECWPFFLSSHLQSLLVPWTTVQRDDWQQIISQFVVWVQKWDYHWPCLHKEVWRVHIRGTSASTEDSGVTRVVDTCLIHLSDNGPLGGRICDKCRITLIRRLTKFLIFRQYPLL